VGGSNQFGNDYMLDYRPNEMCPGVGGSWDGSSNAGVWALDCSYVRASANAHYGLRAACYL